MHKHFNITVTGKVQGVFYRAFTQAEAKKLGIVGFVRNESNGNVYLEAEGEINQLQKLISQCKIGPFNARVNDVIVTESELKNFPNFVIDRSI